MFLLHGLCLEFFCIFRVWTLGEFACGDKLQPRPPEKLKKTIQRVRFNPLASIETVGSQPHPPSIQSPGQCKILPFHDFDIHDAIFNIQYPIPTALRSFLYLIGLYLAL